MYKKLTQEKFNNKNTQIKKAIKFFLKLYKASGKTRNKWYDGR